MMDFSALFAKRLAQLYELDASAGGVPLPNHIRRSGVGKMGLIVNCEFPNALEGDGADRTLKIARAEAVTVLRALSALTLVEDTSSIAVRFGYYDGDQLRETAYACNLPADYLPEAAVRNGFSYWNKSFDVSYPVEYSTIKEVGELLKS